MKDLNASTIDGAIEMVKFSQINGTRGLEQHNDKRKISFRFI